MLALKSYAAAWKAIWKYRSAILFLYLANLVFTFIVTSPYTMYFKNKMEHSDVLDHYDGFDLYMVGEFLVNYGEGLQPLMTLLVIVIGFYFLFGIYANAAILYAVSSRNQYIPLRAFWSGGLNYYWRILRLSLYYILTLVIITGIIVFALLAVGINVLEVADEAELIQKFSWALILLAVLFSVVSIIKQYAKINIAVDNQSFLSGAILRAGGFTFRHFGKTLLLYLINILVFFLVFFIYVNVRNVIKLDLWLVTFILAQILLLFKTISRIVHLHSCFELTMSMKD